MIDIFGQTINPGDSFLRIENQVGGARLRYYFYAGEAEPKQKNGWTQQQVSVQEYGGTPRVIHKPSCSLVKLSETQLALLHYEAPSLEEVLAKIKEKKK